MGTAWPDRRRVVAFQPHRFSRTEALFDEFTRAFYASDSLVVLPIYPAGEPPRAGISSEALCEAIRAHGHKDVTHCADFAAAASHLKGALRSGDLLLTLGAGDIWRLGMEVLELLSDVPLRGQG
jgi:UDP-N-acetylmuramate--alanine ligase